LNTSGQPPGRPPNKPDPNPALTAGALAAAIVAGQTIGTHEEPQKRGPKTDPDAPHNKKIREEAQKLIDEGNTIIAGGGGKEVLIPTPGGYKSGRRPDILYRTPNGEMRARQIVRTNADGTPLKEKLRRRMI
jgi:hypothetical protein